MEFECLTCCAVQEITELSSHRTPHEAMKAFCHEQFLLDDFGDEQGWGKPHLREKLSGFYIFTGVIKHNDGSNADPRGLRYGPAFAAFIRRNGLGRVTASVPAPNRQNHPHHILKVWVWAPYQGAMERWCQKHVVTKTKGVRC